MGYKDGSQIPKEIADEEKRLLRLGYTYAEVSKKTGSKHKTVAERNRLVYKISIWKAFEERIKRDGIPDRLDISDSFGYWFSGFFDGEGTFVVFQRRRYIRGKKYGENRLGIQIVLRQDDAIALEFIYKSLGYGFFRENISKRGKNTNPTCIWGSRSIKDLAEIFIPLFDRYPLHTKKCVEYQYWKELVQRWYVLTLGGHSTRNPICEPDLKRFKQIQTWLTDLRRMRSPNHI